MAIDTSQAVSQANGTNTASAFAQGNGVAVRQESVDAAKAVAEANADAVQQAEAAEKAEKQELDREQLARIAEELDQFVGGAQRGLKFHVDDATGFDVVVVKDVQNDEVIRQIPSEEVLELAARLTDLTAGALMETEV